jgi:hypothetical protein
VEEEWLKSELETLERLVEHGDGAALVSELGRVVSEPRRAGVSPAAAAS